MDIVVNPIEKQIYQESGRMLLVMGRTGSGKDTFADRYCEITGARKLKSFATRPKRSEGEDTHIFITKEEAEKFEPDSKVASTMIGPYEYFATRDQVQDSQVYIVDPVGFTKLLVNCPNTKFYVLYLHSWYMARLTKCRERGDDRVVEEMRFAERDESEKIMFNEFEKAVSRQDFRDRYSNLEEVFFWRNTYDFASDFDILTARIFGRIFGDILQENGG